MHEERDRAERSYSGRARVRGHAREQGATRDFTRIRAARRVHRSAEMRSLVLVAALLFIPSVARAEGDFPSTIASHLAIQCPNPIWDGNGCTLCHQNDFGGCGTATKPFGAWLKQRGLTCSTLSPALLGELLDQAKAEGVDTNCDGVPDVEELETCRWQDLATPSTCDAGAGTTAQPLDATYGCSQSGGVDGGAGVCALLVASLLLRKRRA